MERTERRTHLASQFLGLARASLDVEAYFRVNQRDGDIKTRSRSMRLRLIKRSGCAQLLRKRD
jgi:hypothetical protein